MSSKLILFQVNIPQAGNKALETSNKQNVGSTKR